tara:strand:+ start:2046 stop:2294 length:249 start_codon:yes stop_codon:yes gene_type:complete
MPRKKSSKAKLKALKPVPDQSSTQFKVEDVIEKKTMSKPKEIFDTFDGLPNETEDDYKRMAEHKRQKALRGKKHLDSLKKKQ